MVPSLHRSGEKSTYPPGSGGAPLGPLSLVHDDHGGAISVGLLELPGGAEILIGIDEHARTSEVIDRPHFVSLTSKQAARLALVLGRVMNTGELCEVVVQLLAEIGRPNRKKSYREWVRRGQQLPVIPKQ